MEKEVSIEWQGRLLCLNWGKVATQANGAVLVRYGDTVVLVSAVMSHEELPYADFLPLTVEYQEMAYAAGKIPGGFFKREIGRPSDQEILTARLIDRPIRPLFPEGFNREVQIIATVLSVDQENEPDILAVIGASTALVVSDIPFDIPIAAARVGRIDGQWIVNPTRSQLERSDVNIVVAGHENGIVMVEGGAQFVPEEEVLEGIFKGHEALKPILELQKELRQAVGKQKIEIKSFSQETQGVDLEELAKKVELYVPQIENALNIVEKLPRYQKLKEVYNQMVKELTLDEASAFLAKMVFEDFKKRLVRKRVLEENKRIDGRGFKDIRPITCEVGVLPRTHGSAIFKRGETQVLAVTTLGTSADEQKVDALYGESFKSFMLHYNFPPYCVGEVKRLRGPSRREIGHGALAERALKPVVPDEETFPYTIRVVSEVLESNGSSSMATVCGGCLSLMDAGVPIRTPVAGIAMGLMIEGDKVAILSDIMGDEDHCGDMDFKVAGTREGITAIQMDIKIKGITKEVLNQALLQAKEGRLYILDKMASVLPSAKPQLSPYAPRIAIVDVGPEKIASLIGPGGRVIKDIIAKTGVAIDIKENGKVHIVSQEDNAIEKAKELVKQVTQEVEVGRLYIGKVKKLMDFGALVEILPGVTGLVHISELDHKRVRKVGDILKEGDEVLVRVLEVGEDGKIKLSRKAALTPPSHLKRREGHR